MSTKLFAATATLAVCAAIPSVPGIVLKNAAMPGTVMPAIGLGTGAYNSNPAVGYGGYPECWSTNGGCGAFVTQAVTTWLSVGGRRIDSANSYQNQVEVGAAIAASGVPRADVFLLSKTGPGNALGYNDTLVQFAGVLSDMKVDYVDALLIHWPWDSKPQGNVSSNVTSSTDPLCNHANALYDERLCRLSTWKAMVDIFNSGKARSIGVSNYNVTHFEEILAAGMPLPAITQNPFHLYRSATAMDVKSWADRHGVVFLGYSPFGVPDYKVYPTPPLPVANQLAHPSVLAAAAAHGKTPAQVMLQWAWQLGVPANPRSMNQQHMIDNLAAYDGSFSLTQDEMDDLSSQPQDRCATDKSWYECEA
jgi:diketogulonate reductase-like aldo/keto reductase